MPKKTIINIGDKFINVDGLEFTIVGEGDNYRYICKFTESGYQTEATSGIITKGRVIDNSVIVPIDMNKTYITNSDLEFNIISKLSRDNYHIKFVKSGYETTVNTSAIRRGTIRDYIANPVIEPGNVFKNNAGLEYTIIDRAPGKNKFYCRFNESGYETEASGSHVYRGNIEDRLSPTVCGVGILGYKPDCNYNDYERIYKVWKGMIRRCYDTSCEHYYRYGGAGVTVCDRWKRFDYFMQDIPFIDGFDEEKFNNGDLQLDKDLKQYGVLYKVYSPETCTFLSNKENSQLASSNIIVAVTEDGNITYANSKRYGKARKHSKCFYI